MIWGLVGFSQKVIIFFESYFATDMEFLFTLWSKIVALAMIRILLLGITLSATAFVFSTDHALIQVLQSRSLQWNLLWPTLAGLRLSIRTHDSSVFYTIFIAFCKLVLNKTISIISQNQFECLDHTIDDVIDFPLFFFVRSGYDRQTRWREETS